MFLFDFLGRICMWEKTKFTFTDQNNGPNSDPVHTSLLWNAQFQSFVLYHSPKTTSAMSCQAVCLFAWLSACVCVGGRLTSWWQRWTLWTPNTYSSKEMAGFCFCTLQNVLKRSSVTSAHLSPHTYTARVEWRGIGHWDLTYRLRVPVSQGWVCLDSFTFCHSEARGRWNLLSHPVTVFWHKTDQSHPWFHHVRPLAGQPLQSQTFCHWAWHAH